MHSHKKESHFIHSCLDKGGLAFSDLKHTLEYNFPEVPQHDLDELINRLQIEKNKTKTILDDKAYLKMIFTWYKSLDPTTLHYPLSSSEFLQQKSKNIARHIRYGLMSKDMHLISACPPSKSKLEATCEKRKKGKLLDIGAGDGNLTSKVSEELELEATAVDVTSRGDEEWGGESQQSCLSELKRKNKLIIYDGRDLRSAVKSDTSDFKDPYTVIMFNHCLHHFPSLNAQITGLQHASSLLVEDGVLFFSEHSNILNDDMLHLQHILFDIKTRIKEATSLEEISELIDDYYQRKCMENYLSHPQLTKLLQALGLSCIDQNLRTTTYDASHTIFYTFKKGSWPINFTVIPLSQLKIKSFDDHDVDLRIHLNVPPVKDDADDKPPIELKRDDKPPIELKLVLPIKRTAIDFSLQTPSPSTTSPTISTPTSQDRDRATFKKPFKKLAQDPDQLMLGAQGFLLFKQVMGLKKQVSASRTNDSQILEKRHK